MTTKNLLEEFDHYLQLLFPINRSISGNGNKETLRILKEIAPIDIKEFSSGQSVYDWTIPPEWNVKDAYIKNSNGDKVVDFQVNNLHLMSYSQPISENLHYDTLKHHLHLHKSDPNAIPYRTSYYKSDWGFCITEEQNQILKKHKGPLEVLIDSSFNFDGCLTYGELLIPGEVKEEILISTYFCHPSLANDNLSGSVLTAFLARELLKMKLHYSLRIIFVPETIGAIAYCYNHETEMKQISQGIVVTTVAGPGKFGYKASFDTNNEINSLVEEVFKKNNIDFLTYPFDVFGSDERQYSSAGFRINCISITKDKYYEYPEYHTSLDNLDFISSDSMLASLGLYKDLVFMLNKNLIYKNTLPNCELMLSKRDLYPKTGGAILPNSSSSEELKLILNLLFWCDGTRTLLSISKDVKLPFDRLIAIVSFLEKQGVLSLDDKNA